MALLLCTTASGQSELDVEAASDAVIRFFDKQDKIGLEFESDYFVYSHAKMSWIWWSRSDGSLYKNNESWRYTIRTLGVDRDPTYGAFRQLLTYRDRISLNLGFSADASTLPKTSAMSHKEVKAIDFGEINWTTPDSLSLTGRIQEDLKPAIRGSFEARIPLLTGTFLPNEIGLNVPSILKLTSKESKRISYETLLEKKCVRIDCTHKLGDLSVWFCPEFENSPLKVELRKNDLHQFGDKSLKSFGYESVVISSGYTKLIGKGSQFVFCNELSVKKLNGERSGTRTVYKCKKVKPLSAEDLRSFTETVPNNTVIRFSNAPRKNAVWSNGEVIFDYDKPFGK